MSLEKKADLVLDFTEHVIKIIKLHQYDVDTTTVVVACTNNGVPISIDSSLVMANIKWRKPDDTYCLNPAIINGDGTISFICTQQMLIKNGRAQAELQLLDSQTGGVLHTMPFICVIVGSVYEDDEVSSTNEFKTLTDALIEVQDIKASFDDFKRNEDIRIANETTRVSNESIRETNEIVRIDAENIRITNETDRVANETIRVNNETTRESNESTREANEIIRVANETARQQTLQDIKENIDKALVIETTTKAYMDAAKLSEDNAKVSEDNSKVSEDNAKASEDNAKTSEDNAKVYEEVALDYRTLAESFAHGGTGTRDNEDYDNSYYYMTMCKSIAGGDFVTTAEFETFKNDTITESYIDTLFS